MDIHILILTHLAVSDIPAYARGSKAFSNLAKDDRVWEARWKRFTAHNPSLSSVLDDLESQSKAQNGLLKEQAPPTLTVDADDDFGDFASVNAPKDEMGAFVVHSCSQLECVLMLLIVMWLFPVTLGLSSAGGSARIPAS